MFHKAEMFVVIQLSTLVLCKQANVYLIHGLSYIPRACLVLSFDFFFFLMTCEEVTERCQCTGLMRNKFQQKVFLGVALFVCLFK